MRIAILTIILCLSSCADSHVELVSEEKMSMIMTDLLLSDYTVRQYPNAMRDSIKIELMKSLLKVHKLTKAELDTNLYLYSVDFEKHESLLKVVEVRLDTLREIFKYKEPRKPFLSSKHD